MELEEHTTASGEDPFVLGRDFRAHSIPLASGNSQPKLGTKGGPVAAPAPFFRGADASLSASAGSGRFDPMGRPESLQVPHRTPPESPTKAAHSSGQQLMSEASYTSMHAPSASETVSMPPPRPQYAQVAGGRREEAGTLPARSGADSEALVANRTAVRGGGPTTAQTASGQVEGTVPYPISDPRRTRTPVASAAAPLSSRNSGESQNTPLQLRPPAPDAASSVRPGGSGHVGGHLPHSTTGARRVPAAVASAAATTSSAKSGMPQNAPKTLPAAARTSDSAGAHGAHGTNQGHVKALTAQFGGAAPTTSLKTVASSSTSTVHAGDASRMEGVIPTSSSDAPAAVPQSSRLAHAPEARNGWGDEPPASHSADDWEPLNASGEFNLPHGNMGDDMDQDAQSWSDPNLPDDRFILEEVNDIRIELRDLVRRASAVNASLRTEGGSFLSSYHHLV